MLVTSVGSIRGVVARVDPGSPAEMAGLRAGDCLLAINGQVPRDIIDCQFMFACPSVELELERSGHRFSVVVAKDPDEAIGLEFESATFDGIRECNNHCEFCFIRGLPTGLRPSLYIRDDDYRYSFLFGTFLTLTNLSEEDWERIGRQRLSPLYVSVHATDRRTRNRLLSNHRAPDILEQLDRLGRMRVQVHCQVVLCPGINDGPVLEQTIMDLADRYPTVQSVSVVPVGLTRYSRVKNIRLLTAAEATEAIRTVVRYQRQFRPRLGKGFVYAADELYILAGRSLPGTRSYDDFPMVQNGVGLVRLMMDQWKRVRRKVPAAVPHPITVVWVCGRAVEPALRRMAADLEGVRGLSVEVRPVPNRFFGDTVTVSGLLAGRDLAAVLSQLGADRVVLPRSPFGFDGQRTLDGVTLAELRSCTRAEVVLASSPRELLEATVRT